MWPICPPNPERKSPSMAIFQRFPTLINPSTELNAFVQDTGRTMHAYAIVRSIREIAISIARVWYLMDFGGAFMHIRVERGRDEDA